MKRIIVSILLLCALFCVGCAYTDNSVSDSSTGDLDSGIVDRGYARPVYCPVESDEVYYADIRMMYDFEVAGDVFNNSLPRVFLPTLLDGVENTYTDQLLTLTAGSFSYQITNQNPVNFYLEYPNASNVTVISVQVFAYNDGEKTDCANFFTYDLGDSKITCSLDLLAAEGSIDGYYSDFYGVIFDVETSENSRGYYILSFYYNPKSLAE